MLPIAYAIEECSQIVEPSDIPCQITSTWDYPAPCTDHFAIVYNSLGNYTANFTYQSLSTSGRCFITWNITEAGSYTGTIQNGDTFNITIGLDNMQLALVIGIGITIAAMLFIAFKLDREHFLLQIGLLFFSVALLSLIPAVLIINTANVIFHRIVMGFIIVFWLYVAVYLCYYILKKAGIIASGQNE